VRQVRAAAGPRIKAAGSGRVKREARSAKESGRSSHSHFINHPGACRNAGVAT